MISNQILQGTIDGLKAISGMEFAVMSVDGLVVAGTTTALAEQKEAIMAFVESPAESQEFADCYFFKIFDDEQVPEYVLIVTGEAGDVYMVGKMAAFQLQGLAVAHREKFDKDNFIKNLLLDNMLLIDIYSRSKKLRITTHAKRAVMIVEPSDGKESNMLEALRSYLGNTGKDFVTAVDEHSVVVVKELESEDPSAEMEKVATGMKEHFDNEDLAKVYIAYGNVVNELREVSRSYKEARMALDVGKIFFESRGVVAYSQLGIGRLIYQLPIPLCQMFIKEIFGKVNPDEFDEETLITIQKFFENSLNVSETSRQLFIHRNTLVYRLDKLEKQTGLDIRVFDDAITFQIAMMVVDYMKYMEKADY